MDKRVRFCMAIAAGVIAYTLITLAAMLPIARYMWVGFLPMILYFCTGAHKDWKLAWRMFCSYLCGLAWGLLVNLLWLHMFPEQMLLEGILENGVIIFLMIVSHFVLAGHTVIGFVPCLYLGLCESGLFWGRPVPYIGQGLFDQIPVWEGLGILIFYFWFGMAFAFGVEYLTGFLAKKFVFEKEEPDFEGEAELE